MKRYLIFFCPRNQPTILAFAYTLKESENHCPVCYKVDKIISKYFRYNGIIKISEINASEFYNDYPLLPHF